MASKSVTPNPADGTEHPAGDQTVTTVEVVSMSDTPVPAAFEITLEEFMQKLSLRDSRVELVNGFYFTAKQKGVIKALESTFQAQFVDFTTMVIED
ncbi:hypothetical protein [Pseudomonas sp. Q1]|uniref:hypothetical protein n=2 Tax=Pseudomonas TaxID=286 RepID=UPI001374CBB9|nr:hypothetical protein [Pseudomonas sp. Q1]NCE85297.1 hypothetical protein [Pseudomonas sp. Q1]